MKKFYRNLVYSILGMLTLGLSFSSYGQVTTYPFTEGFDGTAIPTSWTQEYGPGTDDWVVADQNKDNTITPRTGAGMAHFEVENNNVTKLVTPALDLTSLTNPQLTYYVANKDNYIGNRDEIRVYYKAAAGDLWIQFIPYSATEYASWTKFTLDLPDASVDYYIAFEGTSHVGTGVEIDDVTIGEAPACTQPSDLTVTAISDQTIDVAWTAGGSESTWNVSWGDQGFVPEGTGQVGIENGLTANSYEIESLIAEKDYDVYVQADCGGDKSAWTGPVSIKTLCAPTNVPYDQDFDAVTPPAIPTCTTKENIGLGNEWETGVAPSNNTNFTTKVLQCLYSNNGKNTWFYTQGINLTAGTNYQISYDYGNSNFPEKLKVAYGTTPMSDSMTIELADHTMANNTTVLESKAVTFTVPTTGVYYFGFHAYSDNGNQLYLDNILIEETASCIDVSDLALSSVTSNTADITWTAGGSEDHWNISWGQPGYTPEGPNEIGNYQVSPTSTYQITGLVEDTQYDVYVQSDCSGDLGTWVGPLNFNVGYCIPTSDGNLGSSYISGISTSGAVRDLDNTGTTFSSGGYGDYTATDTLIVYPGQTIDFTFEHPDGVTYQYSVWLDWNNNFDFSDAGDELLSSGPEFSPYTVSYTVPTVAALTTTRLRIRNAFSNGPAPACGNFDSGEAEDYVVKIIAEPTCSPVTAINLTDISSGTADIAWTAVNGETSWNISWGEPGFAPGGPLEVGSETGVSTNPYQITGLDDNTDYDVYIKADCGASTSDWSGVFEITTSQIPVSTFPYIQDWETGGTDWTTNNDGTQTNEWVVGSAIANGGTQSLYVSKDEGTSYLYNTAVASVSHTYRDFSFPAVAPEIKLLFDWQSQGETFGADKMRVYIVPTSFVPTPGTVMSESGSVPTGIVLLGSDNYDGNSTFITENLTLPAAYAGQDARIILEWSNDGAGGSQPPAAVDNFKVLISNCPDISDLSADNVGADTIQVTWTAGGSEASWNIEWGTPGFVPGTNAEIGTASSSETTYTVTGLDQDTDYDIYVQADCGANSSMWVHVQGTTLCGVITALPWTENFDTLTNVGIGLFPGCWKSDNDHWYSDNESITTSYSTPNNVSINSGEDDYLWTPAFELTAGTTYEFSFRWLGDGNDGWNGGIYYNTVQSGTNATQIEGNFIDDTITSSDSDYKKEVYCFTPTTSGVFFFGTHVSSTTSSSNISFDNYSLNVSSFDAGIDGAVTVCQIEGLVDLNSVITIADANGTWKFDQEPSAIQNDSLFDPSAVPSGTTDVYYVVEGCASDTATATIEIIPASSAGVNGTVTTCNDGSLDLFDGLTGDVDPDGQWYDPNDQPITGSTVTFNGELAANYNYTYIVSNGVCPEDTSYIEVQLEECAGLDEYELKGFVLYPNPTNGLVNIEYAGKGEDVKLEILDAIGKTIWTEQVQFNDGTSQKIDLSDLESGIYYINMTGKDASSVMKVIRK